MGGGGHLGVDSYQEGAHDPGDPPSPVALSMYLLVYDKQSMSIVNVGDDMNVRDVCSLTPRLLFGNEASDVCMLLVWLLCQTSS